MTVPLQYQSQFIPTDFNTLGNVIGMFRQDMQQRNQEYEQGVAAEQMALAKLAEMETTDPAKKQELYNSLQQRIQDVVKKRGMDYGAAAPDITGIIAKEKLNPWYQFDAAKLGALQDYYKMKNQLGINFYSAQDPNKVTLEQYLADPTALQFQAINVGDLKELAAAKAKEYATANKQFINRSVGNMMREIGWQLGMGDEQKAQQYLQQNPAFINDILSAHNINDPNVRAMVEQAALTGLVGQRDTRFVDDNEAILNYKNRDNLYEPTVIPFFSDLQEGKSQQEKSEKVSPRLKNTTATEALGLSKPSSEGYVGTLPENEYYQGDIDKYIQNKIEKEIIESNPNLQNIEKDLITPNAYNNIDSKYKEDVKSNIHTWVANAKNIVEGNNPLNQTIPIALYNTISPYLESKYPELSKTDFAGNKSKLEKTVNNIVDAYVKSNNTYKSKLKEEVNNYYSKNPDLSKKGDQLLNFTTIDNFNDETRQRLQRLNEINESQLSPSMFVFQAGDLKGSTPEEVVEAYQDEESTVKYPYIIGIGGNEETGIIYSVKAPNGEYLPAKLMVSPDYNYNIAKQLNRSDLVIKDNISSNINQFIPNEVIPSYNNNDIKYEYFPGKGHAGFKGDGSTREYIDNSDIKVINSLFKKQGLPELPIKENVKDSNPYYFKNRQDLLTTVSLINSVNNGNN